MILFRARLRQSEMVLKERSSVAESNWNLSEASGQTGEVTHFLSKALFPNHLTY